MQQIADFAACSTGDTSKCTSDDASTCSACLTSDASDATWGPFVNGSSPVWNIGGCVDLVLGQASLEPSSCGQQLNAEYGCVAYGCATCVPLSYDLATCESAALQQICGGFEQGNACAGLADAGSGGDACFPKASITDPVARQRDFITRLSAFFCGP